MSSSAAKYRVDRLGSLTAKRTESRIRGCAAPHSSALDQIRLNLSHKPSLGSFCKLRDTIPASDITSSLCAAEQSLLHHGRHRQ
jgi:hypothetical protein